jgi:uncharacterized membrane protein YgcG
MADTEGDSEKFFEEIFDKFQIFYFVLVFIFFFFFFGSFGIGSAETNNGFLMGYVIKIRKVNYISGKGLNDYLSQTRADTVTEEMGDFLRNKQYDEAVTLAVDKFKYYLVNKVTVEKKKQFPYWIFPSM